MERWRECKLSWYFLASLLAWVKSFLLIIIRDNNCSLSARDPLFIGPVGAAVAPIGAGSADFQGPFHKKGVCRLHPLFVVVPG